MLILTRFAIAAVSVTVCTNAVFAAKPPQAVLDTARSRVARVAASQAEFTQDSEFKDNDDALLAAAQVAVGESVAQAATAHLKADRLQANASELRRAAYALTDQPGLSSAQNHKMLAAMEAADAAESEARSAQTDARLASAALDVDRQTVAALTLQIASLAQRMDACTTFMRANGYTVQAREQIAPPLATANVSTSR